MNLTELNSYIDSRLTSILDSTEIKKHINEVYLDLTRAFTLDSSIENEVNTVSGQNTLSVGVTARRIKNVLLKSPRTMLRYIHKEAIVYPQANGTPLRWCEYENDNIFKVTLDPIPNSSQAVIFVLEPMPSKLGDNDTPKYIPEEYHHLIAWGAMSVLASIQEEYDMASMWSSRYINGVNEMVNHLSLTAPKNYPSLAVSANVQKPS